jgi:hypothetical protein
LERFFNDRPSSQTIHLSLHIATISQAKKRRSKLRLFYYRTDFVQPLAFFDFEFDFFAADAFAFLSQAVMNLVIAAPRLEDKLLRASARLFADVTSAFKALTCFFKSLMLTRSTLTWAIAPALFFTAPFLIEALGAVFLTAVFFSGDFFTAALRVVAFLATGRAAFFLTAAFLGPAFLTATFLTAVFLTAAFLIAGLAAFFFTAGGIAAFFTAAFFTTLVAALVTALVTAITFGFDVAVLSAVAIIQSPQLIQVRKKSPAIIQ